MGKAKKLRGCSKIAMPDGTLRDVRDYDGTLLMPPEEWHAHQQKIGARLSSTVSDMIAARPELKAAFGMAPDEHEKTVTIMDLLGKG